MAYFWHTSEESYGKLTDMDMPYGLFKNFEKYEDAIWKTEFTAI